MNTYTLNRSDTFNDELQRHILYVATQFSRETAYQVLERIEQSIGNLKHHPFMGKKLNIKEIKARNIRVLILEKLILFYTVTEKTKTINLISLLDQRQDYEYVLIGL